VDPLRDLEIIHDELRIKDMEFLTKQLIARKKDAAIPQTTKNPRDRLKLDTVQTLSLALSLLETQNKDIKHGSWTDSQIEILNDFYFLTSKPVVYLVNLSFDDYVSQSLESLKIVDEIRQRYATDIVIPFSGTFEEELVLLGEDDDEYQTETRLFLESLSKTYDRTVESALYQITSAGFSALDLIYYFTAGKAEVKSWTIRRGTCAPRAAASIHSDFESTFINASIKSIPDIIQNGRDGAKIKTVGRDYEVEDGDVILFNCKK